nr:sulfotransferase family protein [Mycobacterium neglectum]
MGRSGTSALTRVLSLCGVTLPTGMMGADGHNPRGYWEPRTAVLLNETILRRHRSNWFDPTLRLEEEGAWDAAEKAACIADVRAYLEKLPPAPILLVKDMRMTVMTDVWFEAARLAGFDVGTLIAVRNPQEVIPSCAKYVRISPELSSALWLKYNLLAEKHTRRVPRVFVEYSNLLKDWRQEVNRVSKALNIDLSNQDVSAIDEFLTPDLQNNRDCGPIRERFGTKWMSAVYDELHAAARDEPWDAAELDAVLEAYRAMEHDFRTAQEEFRTITNSLARWVLRPSISKPIHAVVALAHRRKGPWA